MEFEDFSSLGLTLVGLVVVALAIWIVKHLNNKR